MKIGYIADVHVGNHRILGGSTELAMNERCRATIKVIESAVWSASMEGCDLLVVLGDLFDTERPPPQMIAAVAKALAGMETKLLVGNHDQVSGRSGDHALGWAHVARTAEVLESPIVVPTCTGSANSLLMVPFQAGDPTEWLPTAVAELAATRWDCDAQPQEAHIKDRTRTLCIHLGLRDEVARKNPWAAKAIDAVDVEWLAELCNEHGITHVFAGNWHHAQDWEIDGVRMFQCGALVPTGWDNSGLDGYGGLVIFDTETGEVERHEMAGPRFVEVANTLDLMAQTKAAKAQGHSLYVRCSCPPSMVTTVTAVLAEADDLAGFDVVVDMTAEREGAERASRAATDQSTLVEALGKYVGEMELSSDEYREPVLQRCAGFLGLQGDVMT